MSNLIANDSKPYFFKYMLIINLIIIALLIGSFMALVQYHNLSMDNTKEQMHKFEKTVENIDGKYTEIIKLLNKEERKY